MTPPILGSIYSITFGDVHTEGYVSYVGKHGYTLTTPERGYPISTKHSQNYANTTFISHPINPLTNKPCTPEEVREHYPEYFL